MRSSVSLPPVLGDRRPVRPARARPARHQTGGMGSQRTTSGLDRIEVVRAPQDRLDEAAQLAATAWDVFPAPAALVDAWIRADELVLIAIDPADGGRLVGVASAVLLGDGRAASEETVVAPGAHGAGVGAALLDALTAALRAAGIRSLHGESSERRLRELPFFLRYGFRIEGVRRARGEPWFHEGDLVIRTRLDL